MSIYANTVSDGSRARFECAAVATSQMSNETLHFGEIDSLRQRTASDNGSVVGGTLGFQVWQKELKTTAVRSLVQVCQS